MSHPNKRGRFEAPGAPRGRGLSRRPRGSSLTSGSASRDGSESTSRPRDPVEVYDGGRHNPSQDIRSLEDKNVPDQFSGQTPSDPLKSQGEKIPLQARYGYGTKGTKVNLWANYFELIGLDDLTLYQYSIIVHDSGNEEVKGHKRRILSSLLKTQELRNAKAATNYVNKLICTKGLGSQQIQVSDPEDNSKYYKVSLTEQDQFHFRKILDDLESPQEIYPDVRRHEAIQALNIALSLFPNESHNIRRVGQNKHFDLGRNADDLTGALVARGGFFHSTRPATGRLLLNVNFTASPFHMEQPLNDLVRKLAENKSVFDDRKITAAVHSYLRGLRVKITYPGAVPKTNVISSLYEWNSLAQKPEQVRFKWCPPSGRERFVDVAQRFKQEYGKILKRDQVVLLLEEGIEYVPAEMCTVLPDQLARQTLSAKQTSNMINVACRRPHTNAEDINQNGKSLMGAGTNMQHQYFGRHIKQQLLAIEGRRLDRPKLQYGRASFVPEGGTWNLKKLRLKTPASLQWGEKFGFLLLRRSSQGIPDTSEFKSQLNDHLQNCGLEAGNISWKEEALPLAGHVENKRFLTRKFEELKENNIRLALVVLPDKGQQLFSLVKYLGDVKCGIHTLCIQAKGDERNPSLSTNDQYFANLALKINVKLGGVNHELTREQSTFMGRTMFIGIDVTHPTGSGTSSKACSIVGVVANRDTTLAQWPASIRTQDRGKEIVGDIKEMVMEMLRSWTDHGLPQRIVVYRDGVSESQYQDVLTNEYQPIKEAVVKFYTQKKEEVPKTAMVVVGKRHHTRFYPSDRSSMDSQNGNVIPGTVVDRGCTMERGFDFYLLAHQGIRGTSRPAHYVVLNDEFGYSADEIQAMTHNLCYLFGRATRAVSYATPAYYADIACERARCYLYDQFHSGGNAGDTASATSAWNRGVHPHLAESMFYI